MQQNDEMNEHVVETTSLRLKQIGKRDKDTLESKWAKISPKRNSRNRNL